MLALTRTNFLLVLGAKILLSVLSGCSWSEGFEMRSIRGSRFARAVVVVTAVGALVAGGTVANAASTSITCYKGTAVKKVSGVNPKCATGWTTKKPVSKPAVAKGAFAFSGIYKGKVALLWSDSDVKATSVTGGGTGNIFGLNNLTASGSAKPTNQCVGLNASGVLSGGGSTLKVSFDTSAKGCAEDSAAPTAINISGNAVVTGGTGKFAGAKGTLKVTGSFAIKSTQAGSSESSAFTATLSGNITTK